MLSVWKQPNEQSGFSSLSHRYKVNLVGNKLKGAVRQIEKALINDRLHISKVS